MDTLLATAASARPWLSEAVCQGPNEMRIFSHPILDFDPSNDEESILVNSDAGEMFTEKELEGFSEMEIALLESAAAEVVAEMKSVVEQKAVAICRGCPVIDQCRSWVTGRDEVGVWGGLTEGQRRTLNGVPMPSQRISSDGNWRGRALNEKRIMELTAAGKSAAEIASEIGVQQRSVHRVRARARKAGIL